MHFLGLLNAMYLGGLQLVYRVILSSLDEGFCAMWDVVIIIYIVELMRRRGMKLTDIQSSGDSLTCHIFCLPRALPAPKEAPEFGDYRRITSLPSLHRFLSKLFVRAPLYHTCNARKQVC